MKKGDVVFSLLVISILLISSVGFVSASWFSDVFGKITGRTVENVTEENVEPECRAISGWRVGDNQCIEDSDCDYDDTRYKYYGKEECENMLESPDVSLPQDTDINSEDNLISSEKIIDENSSFLVTFVRINIEPISPCVGNFCFSISASFAYP